MAMFYCYFIMFFQDLPFKIELCSFNLYRYVLFDNNFFFKSVWFVSDSFANESFPKSGVIIAYV